MTNPKNEEPSVLSSTSSSQSRSVSNFDRLRKTRQEVKTDSKFISIFLNSPIFMSIISLVGFLVASTILILALSKLIKGYVFPYVSIINSCQLIVNLLILNLLFIVNYLKFDISFNPEKAKKFFPLSIVFVAMIYTGNLPYYSQSISSNMTIKRLGVISAILLQWAIMGIYPKLNEIFSSSIIVAGSLLMIGSDKQRNFLAIFLAFTNVCLASVYNCLLGLYCRKEDSFEVLYYMNLLGLPFYLIGATVELLAMGKGPMLSFHYPGFYYSLGLSSSLSIVYSLFAVLANKYNNPLTIIVAGNMKNIAINIYDYFMDPSNRVGKGQFYILGIFMSGVGAFLYGILKYVNKVMEEKGKKRQKEKEKES